MHLESRNSGFYRFAVCLFLLTLAVPLLYASAYAVWFQWQRYNFSFESDSNQGHVSDITFLNSLCRAPWVSEKLLDDVLVSRGGAHEKDPRPVKTGQGSVSYIYDPEDTTMPGLTTVSVRYDNNGNRDYCYIFLNGDGPYIAIGSKR